MATANNTIKTRIQLKSDTEANWNKAAPKEGSNGFVPLSGELIVYTADATHPFSRLKVGDGTTNVVNLPFIDAGTLNGKVTEIITRATYSEFPSPGLSTALYIDLSTYRIYHYTDETGYIELSNFYTSKTTVGSVLGWLPGRRTVATIEDNIFKISNGSLPELLWENRTVVTDVTKEEIV